MSDRRIKMFTTYAASDGTSATPGEVISRSADVAETLVEKGYAEYADDDSDTRRGRRRADAKPGRGTGKDQAPTDPPPTDPPADDPPPDDPRQPDPSAGSGPADAPPAPKPAAPKPAAPKPTPKAAVGKAGK